MTVFGDKIRKYRKSRRLTQLDVAFEATRISRGRVKLRQQDISLLETGKRAPTDAEIGALATYFGTSKAGLMGRRLPAYFRPEDFCVCGAPLFYDGAEGVCSNPACEAAGEMDA